MDVQGAGLADFRAQLERLLASPEFSASRQLREFLRYTSERAFEGASHIDQADIAEAVLGRSVDFDPITDASVRKLASLARQRLDQFYSRLGSETDIVVTLPVRSYVPRFERRVEALQQPILAPVARPSRSFLVWAVFCAVAVLAGVLIWWGSRARWGRAEVGAAPIVLATVKGDITTPGADVPPQAVRLGPALRDVDELSVLLDFTARQEAQQAGLLAWEDADHYIQLGRRLMSRNQLVFTMEENGTTLDTPYTATYDPDGQNGRPLWLAIRRTGSVYRGFKSTDGIRWVEVGRPLEPSRPFQNVRAGIYALNGRREAPSIQAAFSHLATGVTYEGWNGFPVDEMGKAGWQVRCGCGAACLSEFEPSVMRLSFGPAAAACDSEWLRPVAVGDWEVTAKLDYFPAPGMAAGLGVRGTRGAVRLVRYFLNGPAISMIHDTKTLVGVPDFNGSPALFVRLQSRAGILMGSYSLDGARFYRLPPEVHVDQLGADLRVGLRLTAKGFSGESGFSPVRVFFYRESITRLVPFRQP
jgi:hypothetical protein